MQSKNILYYNLNEYTSSDAKDALSRLGYNVIECRQSFSVYDNDEKFITAIKNSVLQNKIDIIFSFNYYPDLSRAANEAGVRYVSWVFDSPHRTLDSVTLGNSCNTVNIFDYALCEHYISMGISTVRYMPLACNVARVQNQLDSVFTGSPVNYEHDITFLGTLYDDEYNFYDQIKFLPDYLKGYIDAAMEVQTNLYGIDMISQLLNDKICDEMNKYVKFDMGPEYIDCRKEILVSMIQKNITVKERHRLLTVLGEYYKVDHYAGKKSSLPVNYKGYASYTDEMPHIFATSKINLNISLRSILTGIPLRVIDILGARGFCISNYQAELAEYFENDKSIVWYESYEDLFGKIAYYLKNDSEREAIALAGHKIVAEQFTYDVLFPKVLA